jgi:hypothetical protein
MTAPIQATWFHDAFDAVDPFGKTRTYTWPEFVADLAQRLAFEGSDDDRRGLPMFTPAAWRGNRRLKVNVAALTLGVLDLDGIPQAELDRVCAALSPFQAAVYSSPRDPMPDGRRKVRVITALDQAILPEDCARLRVALSKALNVENDPSIRTDESRGFFVGRLKGAPARQLWVSPGNQPVAVRPLMDTVPATPPKAIGSVDLPDTGGEADELVGPQKPATLAVLAETLSAAMRPGQKNLLIYALGGTLRQWGWSAQDAAELARLTLEHRSRTAGDVGDITAGVEAIVRGYFVDNPHGWDRVKELIGPTADVIEANVPTRWNASKRLMAELQQDPWYQAQTQALTDRAEAETASTAKLAAAQTDDFAGFRFLPPGDGKPFDALVEGLEFAPKLGIALLGKYGRAKSPTAIELGLSLANGIPWAGRKTQRCEVFYFAAEKVFDLQEKRDRVARAMGVDPCSMGMAELDEPLNAPGIQKRMELLVQRRIATGAKVVLFIDTYAASVEGLEHNSSEFSEPLKKILKATTGAGACVIPILHARKGGAADKPRPPTMDDAEGVGGIMGALSGCMGVWGPDEDDKDRVQYVCVRPVRKGHAPFERKWVDVAQGAQADWGLRSEEHTAAEDAPAIDETMGTKVLAVVNAAAGLLRELCSKQGVELRPDVVHTRSLKAISELIAKPCGVTPSFAAQALVASRSPDIVNTQRLPFWGRADDLNLALTPSDPVNVFNGLGAGYQEQAPPAPHEAPKIPQLAPPLVGSDQLRSAIEASRNAGGYDGPAAEWFARARVPLPDEPIARRTAMNHARAYLGPGDTLEGGNGKGRPAWLIIRPTG